MPTVKSAIKYLFVKQNALC